MRMQQLFAPKASMTRMSMHTHACTLGFDGLLFAACKHVVCCLRLLDAEARLVADHGTVDWHVRLQLHVPTVTATACGT